MFYNTLPIGENAQGIFHFAGERWLPQYQKAIAEAKRRVKGGKRLPTREFKGAARLATKSVEEMAKDRIRKA